MSFINDSLAIQSFININMEHSQDFQSCQLFQEESDMIGDLPLGLALNDIQEPLSSQINGLFFSQVEERPQPIFMEDEEEQERARRAKRERKRASNTIFKTSLGKFRQSIRKVISTRQDLSLLQQSIREAYLQKNQSVFPKLLAIVRQLGIGQQVAEVWEVKSQQLIKKKESMMNEGLYDPWRLKELEDTIDRMDKAIEEQDFDKSFRIYWGDARQTMKQGMSKKDVVAFKERFAKAYRLWLHEQDSQDEPAKARQGGFSRRSKKSKNPSRKRKISAKKNEMR